MKFIFLNALSLLSLIFIYYTFISYMKLFEYAFSLLILIALLGVFYKVWEFIL